MHILNDTAFFENQKPYIYFDRTYVVIHNATHENSNLYTRITKLLISDFRKKQVSWPSWLRHRANNAGISGSIPLETISFLECKYKIPINHRTTTFIHLCGPSCCGQRAICTYKAIKLRTKQYIRGLDTFLRLTPHCDNKIKVSSCSFLIGTHHASHQGGARILLEKPFEGLCIY